MKPIRITTRACLLILFSASLAPHAYSAPAAVNCETIMSTSYNDTIKLNGEDVRTCMRRGYSAPQDWRPKDGMGSGEKIGGASGWTHAAVHAPESPPGARNANAAVSASVIRKSCDFPPRLSINTNGINLPRGSCYDFLNDLFKDKNNLKNSDPTPPPPPIPPTVICPVESDTTGIYGAKQPIVSGGGTALECGGLMPASGSDMVLSPNADHIAITENGVFKIWIYAKVGNVFQQVAGSPFNLPQLLCDGWDHGKGVFLWHKDTDLTPPVGQFITYNSTDPAISVRLQPRESMDGNNIPPYQTGEPEKYLYLPINAPVDMVDSDRRFITRLFPPGGGIPLIPISCDVNDRDSHLPTQSYNFWTANSNGQPIQIRSAITPGCQNYTYTPRLNTYKECKPGSKWGNQWRWECSQSPFTCCNHQITQEAMDAFYPPSGGHCPQAPYPLPPGSVCTIAQSLPDDPCAAGSQDPTADANCDLVTFQPDGLACQDQRIYGTLDKPAVLLPSGASPSFSDLTGRTEKVLTTVDDTKIFAQSNTIVLIRSTAPNYLVDDGGTIILKDGSQLVLQAPATIQASTGSIVLTNGGKLLTTGGKLLQVYPSNTTYTIPANLLTDPLELHMNRSITLPAGYLIPSMAQTPATGTIPAQDPYLRLPTTPIPQ